MIGTSIGTFRITAKLGAGGMGEVYRATDTKLKRDVALKVLPEAFSRDPERLARFEREAEVLASLNHPNIAAIYGVVEERALVMELVEGAEPKGPLPFDEAWAIMSQMAAALDYAHEKGVVHRDLKPANIKVTPDGQVKLLDFGLAKAFSNQPDAATNPENSPTLTIGATQAGVILGTAAYMSPEQARGKEVDKRADIWAFGIVLAELITGKRLFEGEDVGDTLAAVIKEQPNLDAVPPQVRALLKRCLEKDPKKRLRDIGDMELLLGAEAPASPAQSPPTPRHRSWLPWCAAAFFLLALGALSFVHFRETPPPEQTLRYAVALPENSTVHSFAISPDGRTLVVAVTVNGKRQLWLRPMDALQFQPMAFTEDATYPFWSPDSRTIGFFAQGKLKKLAANGGPAQSLCDVANARGGSWNRDDIIVFSPNNAGGSIQRVAAAGGVPVDVTKTKGTLRHPVFLPDRRHFFYSSISGAPEQMGIYVASLDGKENRRVLPDASAAVFAPPQGAGRTGHILFVRENTLMAAPFDTASAQLSGDVFPVAEGVSLTTDVYYVRVTVSENGVLLYEAGGAIGENQIGWYDRAGKSLGPLGAPGNVWTPAISPDEKAVAFRRVKGAGGDLWVRDLSRGTETRFTNDPSNNGQPFWSPRGDRIVFASNRKGGVYNLYQKATSGTGQDELLLPNTVQDISDQWSRDGRFIVYREFDPKTKDDLWVLPTEGPVADRKPIPFLRTEFNEFFGQLSPDGHWMAFTSDRSGRREVYVRPFPPSDGEWTISVAGGEQPRWRGDGKELFFEAADGKMMAVPVKAVAGTKPSFEAGTPLALFEAHMAPSTGFNYDVTADGKRFLINTRPDSSASSPPLTVVTNWTAGLKK